MTPPPDSCGQPAQDHPGWRLWVSSTGRWWALRQTPLTPTQITAGCHPLIYAPDNPTLTTLINEQNNLRANCPTEPLHQPLGRRGAPGELRTANGRP